MNSNIINAPISKKAKIDETEKGRNFFPIRQSVRKTKTKVKDDRIKNIQQAIRDKAEETIEVRMIPNKGRGLFATQCFQRGDFIAEYAGDLIDMSEARYREHLYASMDQSGSSYMFYFKFKEKTFW